MNKSKINSHKITRVIIEGFPTKRAYSGTLPYDHPVNTTTSLLWPLYAGPKKAQSVISPFKEPL